MKHNNISAVILAGGRATRMGGQDKGLLEISGETMVARIVQQISLQCDQVVINANRNIEQYAKYSDHIISDTLEDFQGPLAGMLAAMENMNHKWLITLPCDGPFIAPDYCDRMMSAITEHAVQIAVASDGERLQPVYALLHRDLVSSLTAFLESGDRKIDRWYAQHQYATVSFADHLEMFINVNTPQQLSDVETEISD